ncbi:MAG: LytTR family DNA-binding domain-containing protein [Candidatus Pseudobacter hemicellulosilyticus]|uniref:LytTR family DNA-binding domain-containing protein n=1 Tax=Candidatus Pseudobacter hemicellulosilyticus TaxID=3121375 RepID=A0AAJ6BHQ5_9BACT|nr:MAG: LytTR family DNA-binding domain-containing protein [Pseudobacter sp.]
MTKLNCLIIDDEPWALDLLEDFIQKIPYLRLAGRCEGPVAALPYFEKEEIDLIFLDIRMPDLSGIQFLKTLSKKPSVIFVTAYNEFAVEGYELDAIDYLLKPVPFDRFVAAVSRAQEYIGYRKNRNSQRNDDFLFIKTSHKIQKIFYNDIVYLEGLKDYTRIHLAESRKPVVTLQSLKYFESRLPSENFIRIHRSYIVSLRKVDTVARKTVFLGETELPCSEHYRNILYGIIGEKL